MIEQDRSVMPTEAPLAFIAGEPLLDLPEDLYIPPAALRIFLSAFEGPLDLLWYLIKKHNIDILDIPIADITLQYVEYVDLMKDLELELAADYLVMAATLAHIKSRLLLPRSDSLEDAEQDPRAELVRRLQEYERFKLAAEHLDALPRYGRDVYSGQALLPEFKDKTVLPEVALDDMLQALKEVMHRATLYERHHVLQEPLSIRERMSATLELLQHRDFVNFSALFTIEEGRLGIVVSFIAILELLKQDLIEIVQTDVFSPIHIKAKLT